MLKRMMESIVNNASGIYEHYNVPHPARFVSPLELATFMEGIKPAFADAVTLNRDTIRRLKSLLEFTERNGIYMSISSMKFIINSPRGIYVPIPLDDKREGKIIYSVARTREDAKNGVEYYYKKLFDGKYSTLFGRLMGYPECCLEFGKSLDKTIHTNLGWKNPAVESLLRSRKFSWKLNVFSSANVLPWYPCHLDCRESKKFMDSFLSISREISPEYEQSLEWMLKEPWSLYWTCADRIMVKGEMKRGILRYSEIYPDLRSGSYYQMNDKSFLERTSKVRKLMEAGNELSVSDGKITIMRNGEMLGAGGKTHKYDAVLVRPD